MTTLLVGDASPSVHRIVDLTFSGQNIDVVAVTDGEQAVAQIAARPPDIVLVDVAMPTRTGYDVCEYVKHTPRLAHIPVLLLTGAFEPVDDTRARQVRWDGVVVKPFEPQNLAARVRELLAGRTGSTSNVVAGVPRAIDRLGLRRATPVPKEERAGESGHWDRMEVVRDDFGGINSFPSEVTRPDPVLDEYFERLNTALAGRPAPAQTEPQPAVTGDGSGEPAFTAIAEETRGAPRVEDVPDGEIPTLDRVLGKQSPVATSAPAAESIITDALIDEITRRVLRQLSTDALDRVVADIVSDVAERLVREEIARVRQIQGGNTQTPSLESQIPNPKNHIPSATSQSPSSDSEQ